MTEDLFHEVMLALLTPKFLSAPRDAHTKVHFQAKRWKNPVGANAIRDFIGGIQTSRGEYGIFVTTSEFTRDAIETAKKSGKVKLVDGHEMARLMIEYSLGVAKTRVHVAKIDRDYFEGL